MPQRERESVEVIALQALIAQAARIQQRSLEQHLRAERLRDLAAMTVREARQTVYRARTARETLGHARP